MDTQKFSDILIPVPWGHLAGKWWGPTDRRPILALHGWQDSAGTFDTLAPLLPKHTALLAIDLPGHGRSSWFPDGMFYQFKDYLLCMRLIMKEYKWKKISLLSHSMGAVLGFIFAAMYPDEIDFVIALDVIRPVPVEPEDVTAYLQMNLTSSMERDEQNRKLAGKEPPSFSYEELLNKFFHGELGSVDKSHCKYIMDRNIKPSKMYPGKYYFSRDGRLKGYFYPPYTNEMSCEIAEEITVPYLCVKARDSIYTPTPGSEHCLEVLRKNPKFEFYEVDGTHHVHLNNPERIIGFINNFLEKYHKPENDDKKVGSKL